MTTNQSCGQAMMSLLEAYGVRTVFGMPGVHTLEFYRGLAGTGLRHVLFRHEQGGAFMADGFARVTGQPGVCLVITGPGVTNAATGIGQAYSDSSPVLLLSSVNATADLGSGRGRLHENTDQRATTAPLTAFSQSVLTPAEAPAALARAFAVFAAQRPRPCHVEVPIDTLERPAGFGAAPLPLPSRPVPEGAAVERAAALCAPARRTVIIAGGGTVDAAATLRALAERLGAAVLLTTAGKGLLPAAHPLNAGSVLSTAAGQALLGSADLVIAVGTELAETDSWAERLPLNGRLLRIDIDPATALRDYPPDAVLVGDAGTAMHMLHAALPDTVRPGEFGDGREVAALREGVHARLMEGGKSRRHVRALEALREVLPADGFVSTDMTQIAYTGNVCFAADRPRCYLHPNGYGTLGFGLPAAIGGKIGAPARAGVALCGDAGFLFTVQELATAVDERLPLAVVLWNNDCLGQIRDGMAERGIPPIGVVPRRNPDFLALAGAFGAHAARGDTREAFQHALADAFKADGPTLIELREDAAWLD